MKTTIEKMPKSTLKINVIVDKQKVKEAYEKALDDAVKNTEVQGFRLGKAPKEMVKDKVGVSKIYGDVIDALLQTYYPQALKENAIIPVANPKVEIKEFDLEKDFEFTATVPTKPEIKIGDYKEKLKKLYEEKVAERQKANAERITKGEPLDETHVHLGSNDLVGTLLEVSSLEISDVLIEEETERMMANFLNQVQTIGLSMESYLKSQNKTAETLRKEYEEIAQRNLKAEFILQQLVLDLKLTATDDEVEETIKAVGDPKIADRLRDPVEKMYVKNMLLKNKAVMLILQEVEGENAHEHK